MEDTESDSAKQARLEVSRLREENDRLKKEVATQKQTIQDAQNGLKDATSQVDRLKIELDVVVNEREIHLDKLLRVGEEAQRTEQEFQEFRSKKMLVAPILSDGEEVTWDYWLFMTKARLQDNANKLSDPTRRVAYVVSRCSGKALTHITPRLREDAWKPYKDYQDVIDHLKMIFETPAESSRSTAAFEEMAHHSMLSQHDFLPFLEEFIRLADESTLPESWRKHWMFHRLTGELQEADPIYRAFRNDNIGFPEFCQICRRIWHLREFGSG